MTKPIASVLLLLSILLNSAMFAKSFARVARTAVRSSAASAALRPAPMGGAAARSLYQPQRWMSSPSEEQTSVVETCRTKIAAALETEDVKVIGAYDDPNGSHISIEVTSAMFEGKRPVQRQQLVYKALWEELQGAVHAVDSMVCKTPDEK